MKVDIKVLIGLGVVGAVGYYLWKKSKPKESVVKPNEEKEPDDRQEIKRAEYFAKDDITLGFLPNSSEPNVIIRKGDKVVGRLTTRSGAFGNVENGIMAQPTVSTAILPVGGSGLFFVPFSKIETKWVSQYVVTGGGVVTRPDPLPEQSDKPQCFKFKENYTAYGGRNMKASFSTGQVICGLVEGDSVTTKAGGRPPTPEDLRNAMVDAVALYRIPIRLLDKAAGTPMFMRTS